MISFDVPSNQAGLMDAEFINEVAAAVFHYFKNDLKMPTITMGELCEAIERVLVGFVNPSKNTAVEVAERISEADLGRLADESAGNELLFFSRLRAEVRARLKEAPAQLRFCGLRRCVKQLVGTRRWTERCGNLRDQIVEFLRGCLQAETGVTSCPVVVD
jgi:hypothetical protein